MKIGITCYPTYGGSGAVATELGIELAARGHEVHFITYGSRSGCPRFSRASTSTRWTSAAIRCSSIRHTTSRWPCGCTRSCVMHELDLLHALRHSARDQRLDRARDAARADGATEGHHHAARHRHHPRRPGSVVLRHHQVLDREIGRVTAVSEYLRDETYRAFGCTACDVEVIPNFIDPAVYNASRIPPLLRRQIGGGRKVLMHISNFRRVKRVRDVVRIFAGCNKQIPGDARDGR